MEAETLERKQRKITKWKLKKNIKNVLCRPDKVFWPELNEEEGRKLENALKKYKIDIPHFEKLHWNELKLIPKEKRPKPPKPLKVNGLLFGITECTNAVDNGECAAVIIEAKVNPTLIVQPLIDKCVSKQILVLCLNDLRTTSKAHFGIATSCLGVKSDLSDLMNEISSIAKNHPLPINNIEEGNIKEEKMDITGGKVALPVPVFNYLYRTKKKTRVFIPSSGQNLPKGPTKFIGQDFIEFSSKPQNKQKAYTKMVLKRISNNPDRVKKK